MVTVFVTAVLPSLAASVTVYSPAIVLSHRNSPVVTSKEAPSGIPSASNVTASPSGSEVSTVNERDSPADALKDVPHVITGGSFFAT